MKIQTPPPIRTRFCLALDTSQLRDFKIWAAQKDVHFQEYLRDILDQAHKHIKTGGKP